MKEPKKYSIKYDTSKIKSFLKKHNIHTYSHLSDNIYNINQSITLDNITEEIPIKINILIGNLVISNSNIIDLNFLPKNIVGNLKIENSKIMGSFNRLKEVEHFFIEDVDLKNLEGLHDCIINKDFILMNTTLINILDFPKIIHGDCSIKYNNNLLNLMTKKSIIKGDLFIYNNLIFKNKNITDNISIKKYIEGMLIDYKGVFKSNTISETDIVLYRAENILYLLKYKKDIKSKDKYNLIKELNFLRDNHLVIDLQLDLDF